MKHRSAPTSVTKTEGASEAPRPGGYGRPATVARTPPGRPSLHGAIPHRRLGRPSRRCGWRSRVSKAALPWSKRPIPTGVGHSCKAKVAISCPNPDQGTPVRRVRAGGAGPTCEGRPSGTRTPIETGPDRDPGGHHSVSLGFVSGLVRDRGIGRRGGRWTIRPFASPVRLAWISTEQKSTNLAVFRALSEGSFHATFLLHATFLPAKPIPGHEPSTPGASWFGLHDHSPLLRATLLSSPRPRHEQCLRLLPRPRRQARERAGTLRRRHVQPLPCRHSRSRRQLSRLCCGAKRESIRNSVRASPVRLGKEMSRTRDPNPP
jgi:hypothetical protein